MLLVEKVSLKELVFFYFREFIMKKRFFLLVLLILTFVSCETLKITGNKKVIHFTIKKEVKHPTKKYILTTLGKPTGSAIETKEGLFKELADFSKDGNFYISYQIQKNKYIVKISGEFRIPDEKTFYYRTILPNEKAFTDKKYELFLYDVKLEKGGGVLLYQHLFLFDLKGNLLFSVSRNYILDGDHRTGYYFKDL